MMTIPTDDTIPTAAGTCPKWCSDPKPHPWEHVGEWTRMHSARISDSWLVSQVVCVNNEDGTIEYTRPEVECTSPSFDTVEDGEAILAELRQAIEVLRQAVDADQERS